MSTAFITSTGTEIGKTFVTTALIAAARAAGRSVAALKPVVSGFDPSQPAASDTGALLDALGAALDASHVDDVSPWRFAAPLSPDMAAAREGRRIDFDALVEFCLQPRAADMTLIEGIGGVMVPLDDRHTVLDWIAALRCPVLLVVGSYLGTLSHTLTAAAALEGRGCPMAGIIVSESLEQPVQATETATALRTFLRAPVLVMPRRFPADPGLTAEIVALLD